MKKDVKKIDDVTKEIECYLCGSKLLTAYFYFTYDNKPMISFGCGECKEPIMSVATTTKSIKFVLFSEDIVGKLKED